MQFHKKRRQQFLSEHYFSFFCKSINEAIEYWKHNLPPDIETKALAKSLAAADVANQTCDLFLLRYTGGESLVILRDELVGVVEAYEKYAKCKRDFQEKEDFPVFAFQEIDDFERILQLLGLAILMHRHELISRIHSLIANSAYDGQDAMYEELVGHVLPGRPYLEAWYHQLPYLHLLSATDLESSEEKIEQMQQYLKIWYKSMSKAPWHDSHLKMTEEGGGYFGYWAIEAAAIVYLYKIDDRSFRDHIVYPKDLVDFARELDKQATPTFLALEKLRVEGGKPCPQTGYWYTPAIADSRRHFEQGEIMPVSANSQYGATIWQWSEEQLPPLKPTVE
ncbi:DUF1911 domain-containing protein [Rugamonas sp. A1-17]|nr:DUF1911 domain-containing protein [Rugamonas sp. A1-17]